MTMTQQIDALALEVAAELGRDWTDCGAYERQSYRDEAARRLEEERPVESGAGADYPATE